MWGVLLDNIYDVNWDQETESLLKDARTFGASLFGDGVTQKTVPMINCLGARVYNPFAILDGFPNVSFPLHPNTCAVA